MNGWIDVMGRFNTLQSEECCHSIEHAVDVRVTGGSRTFHSYEDDDVMLKLNMGIVLQ
jgi:hypothetical protein